MKGKVTAKRTFYSQVTTSSYGFDHLLLILGLLLIPKIRILIKSFCTV